MSKFLADPTHSSERAADRPAAASKAAPTKAAPKGAATKKAVTKTAAAKPAAKKPAAKAPAKPAPKSTPKPAPKAAPKAASKTPAKASPKPAAKPARKVAAAKPSAKPASKTSAKPASKPVAGKQAAKPVAKAAPKPAAKAPAVAPAKVPTKASKPSSTPATNPTGATPSVAPTDKKAAPAPVEKVITKPEAKSSEATKPAARSGSKNAVHMPLPAVPTQAEQASRFADRFAPSRATSRVVIDTSNESQKRARKDPKLANAWKTKAGRELTEDELLAMPDDAYMNEEQLDFFRKRLSDLKNDLLSNAGETTEHLREDTSIVPDPADRATIEEEHALELRTRDRERKLLKKISQSLGRIESGEYGYCDETGEPIGVARLLARPTATLSLEAQQRRELKQKMFGD